MSRRRYKNTNLILTICGLLLASGAPVAAQATKAKTANDAVRVAALVETMGLSDPRQATTPKKRPARLAHTGRAAKNLFATEVRLPALDHKALIAQDEANRDTRKRLRIGTGRAIVATERDGRWQSIAGEGDLWTLAVVSEGAIGMRVHFSGVDLPPGAQLTVWSPAAPRIVDGPFTGKGALGRGEIWSTSLAGERVHIEYLRPVGAGGRRRLPFTIDRVVHIYRDPLAGAVAAREGDCHNDTSCFPQWDSLRASVALIEFVDEDAEGVGVFSCTGQLLNSMASDLTPYFLTANHCVGSQAVAETLAAYWFYQTDVCKGMVPFLYGLPRSGVADFLDGSGFAQTDHSLLLIRGALPLGVFWSGWTTATPPPRTTSTCIHHPDASFKRISFGTRSLSTGDYWRIDWKSGVTEVGSSGAGIWFGNPPLLFGQLSHGESSCDLFTWDNFGKFSTYFSGIESILQGGSDDDMEENDTCVDAVAVDAGTHFDRVVKLADSDWYSVSVPSCADLEINLAFSDAFGDIDMELFDACGGSPVAVANGPGNGETIVVPSAGVSREYLLHVFLTDDTRNTYNLSIAMPTPVGSSQDVTTHPGNTPPSSVPIPDEDPTGIARLLNIPENGTITDVDLELSITHTWNGDLRVMLEHGGVSATLIDRPGLPAWDPFFGFDNTGYDITLDDAAGTSIEDFYVGPSKVVGTFAPHPGALGAFNGMDQAGTWALRISDNSFDDIGQLDGWALRMTTRTESACLRADGAADICSILDPNVDLIDVAYFQTCFTGSGPAGLDSCCGVFDAEADDDVDVNDHTVFHSSLTGPGP